MDCEISKIQNEILNGTIFLFLGVLDNSAQAATIPKIPNHLTEKVTKNVTMTAEVTLEETKAIARNTTVVVETYASSKEKVIRISLFRAFIHLPLSTSFVKCNTNNLQKWKQKQLRKAMERSLC